MRQSLCCFIALLFAINHIPDYDLLYIGEDAVHTRSHFV